MGPGASILLRNPLSETQIDELEQWLKLISSQLGGQRADWWPIWIRDGRRIGLPIEDVSTACSFGLVIERIKTEEDYTNENGAIDQQIRSEMEERRVQVMEHLGYYPQQAIVIDAGCNAQIDHQILGHLALHLAERYDGIVNMNGAITPPLRSSTFCLQASYPAPTLQEITAFVKSLPGQVYEIYSTSPSGSLWVSHMVDTTFLEAWLHHPNFHMIK